MWWRIFDKWGNQLGEIRETDPDAGGCGCAVGSIAFLIVSMGAVLVWPAFIYATFSSGEILLAIIQFISLISIMVVQGRKALYEERYSFIKTWFVLIGLSTIVASLVWWVASGLSIVSLFAYLFINFLLSIGGGLITSIIVACLRRKF